MFGPSRADSSLVLPLTPLHEMYALPARRYIEASGGEVRLNALARVRIEAGRIAGVEVRGEPLQRRAGRRRRPVVRARVAARRGHRAAWRRSSRRASRMASKPIVTVNLWYDRAVMDDVFVGLPGRRDAVGLRQAAGVRRGGVAPVARGQRRRRARRRRHRDARRARRARSRGVDSRRARRDVSKRGTVIREKRATFSLAPGEPARPGVDDAGPGLFLAGDWIETGLPGTIESAAVAGHLAAALANRNRNRLHRNRSVNRQSAVATQ